jgi:hypothetical protein
MKSHQKLSKASRYPNQILNQALPEYTSEGVYDVSRLAWQWAKWRWNINSGSQDTLHELSVLRHVQWTSEAVLDVSWDAVLLKSCLTSYAMIQSSHTTISSENTTPCTSLNIGTWNVTGYGARYTHFDLLPRLRMSGHIPLCPLYTFMA